MSFIFKILKIPEVILIQPKFFLDKRGFFMETYKQSLFVEFGIKEKFVQENHSRSKKSVLRGLHYQKNPKAQAKLVRCISGKIFDVAVDIRKKSPTYGNWVGVILSEQNKKEIFIPKGFAHGFCVLSEQAEIVYKASNEYSLKHERGIIWNDPKINIKWPTKKPIVSKKDSKFPLL
jgi:dTDP-4-dehydrorhamnose 3,5-epimerase